MLIFYSIQKGIIPFDFEYQTRSSRHERKAKRKKGRNSQDVPQNTSSTLSPSGFLSWSFLNK